MNNEVKILNYKKSLESAWGFNDYNDWPIKFNSIMHLFLNNFTDEFLRDYNKLIASGISKQEIAESFYNPSRIYRIIHTVIYGMKNLKYSVAEQKKMAVELLDMASLLKTGSIYNEDGKNIIYNTEELNENTNKNYYKVEDTSKSMKLHRALGILWAYTEAIFFRAHDVTKEIHGLYDIGNDYLLVREYMNLMPQYLWDLVDVSCNKIKIYTKYTKDINLHLDSYNHQFHLGGSLIDSLLEYRIEIDEKESSLENLLELLPKLTANISNIQDWSKNSDWREKTLKYAEIYWFRKSPLCKLLGLPLEVPNEVMKNIETGNVDERRLSNLTDRQIKYLIYTFL